MAAFKSKGEKKKSYEDFNSDDEVSPAGRLKPARPKDMLTVARTNTKRETAEYISGMIVELRALADSSDHVFLAYLLDMAYEEAVTAANKH
ncbi:MAG: hypothetical protein K8F25_08275 [Fimbriimonadaceae bacterium]|nr:hypothetical protein [Alphaproteobacteria bacterium]